MTEIQSLDLQRSGFAQLRSLCTQIVQTDSELMNKDRIQEFLKPLSKILIDLELFEWFYKALASYRRPRTQKRSNRGNKSTRKLPATDVGSMISLNDTNTKNDRDTLRHRSVETRSLDVHPRPCDSTAGAEKEEEFFRETMERYDHIPSLAKLDQIGCLKKNPQALLKKLRPTDRSRLERCDLKRLLDYRYDYNLSDKDLFRYYEGAKSLSNSDFKLRTFTPEISRVQSTKLDTHKTQQRILKTLQRTSTQVTEAIIESRYYKLALYCQIGNIEKRLSVDAKSTTGVSLRTKAIREWIGETTDSELKESSVRSWRKQGEKWKTLCDRFTPGILEASHEALDAW
jgi:hypothetical protein